MGTVGSDAAPLAAAAIVSGLGKLSTKYLNTYGTVMVTALPDTSKAIEATTRCFRLYLSNLSCSVKSLADVVGQTCCESVWKIRQ